MRHFVFEGPDGSGKSTCALKTVSNLQSQNRDVIYTKHPGATPLGQKLRELLKHDLDTPIDPITGQLLFLADYNSFINSILKPAQETNKIIISDRANFISGIIYAAADDVNPEIMIEAYQLIKMPKIDVLFIFNLPFEIAKERILSRHEAKCRYEEKGEQFLKKVNELYHNISEKDYKLTKNFGNIQNVFGIKRIVQVDASQSKEEIQAFVDNVIYQET